MMAVRIAHSVKWSGPMLDDKGIWFKSQKGRRFSISTAPRPPLDLILQWAL